MKEALEVLYLIDYPFSLRLTPSVILRRWYLRVNGQYWQETRTE